MRVDILAIGSLGDVRPAVALGHGMQRAGHRIRIVTLGGFEKLARESGLAHLSIGASPQEIASSEAGRDWVEQRRDALGFLRGFVRVARSLIERGTATYWPACRDVEALVVTTMGLPVGMHVAERLQVPLIRASFAPTRHDWAEARNLTAALQGRVARLVWAAFRLLIWDQLRGVTNATRARVLGLPPLSRRDPFGEMDRRGVPVLDAYSRAVVPRASQWDSWIHVTGYWFMEEPAEWRPSGEVVNFLASGPPPVFVGFGSTPFPHAAETIDVVSEALARAGRRGVVVAGGSGLPTGRINERVLSIDGVPHSWLFPRVCAAVHHGGAGVTAAALRAGLPAVVVPVFGDQPFWARRLFELGAAAPPLPVKRLTVDTLAGAIRLTAGEEMKRRAAALGAQIREENGVARAVEAIEAYLAPAPAAGSDVPGAMRA